MKCDNQKQYNFFQRKQESSFKYLNQASTTARFPRSNHPSYTGEAFSEFKNDFCYESNTVEIEFIAR